MDAVQNRREAYELGAALLKRRIAAKFAPVSVKRSIAFCYPGDDFRGAMLDSILDLYAHFISLDFEILRMRSASTIVYETRADIWRTILNQPARPDLILMLDHDNPLRRDQFDVLLSDLDSHPEVDGVSGLVLDLRQAQEALQSKCGIVGARSSPVATLRFPVRA